MAAMLSSERWAGNWRAVSPEGSVHVFVGRGRDSAKAALAEARILAPGVPVVVVAEAPGSVRRSRRLAAAAGIQVEREYLALPSAKAPAYLIEDEPEAFRVFVEGVLASPGHGVLGRIQDVVVALVRRLRPRRVVSGLAAGRVLVGRRT
jgi:hypothetical protein